MKNAAVVTMTTLSIIFAIVASFAVYSACLLGQDKSDFYIIIFFIHCLYSHQQHKMSIKPVQTIEGNFIYKRWYNHKGLLHREDGPALIKQSGEKILLELWYKDGKIYRQDGPASITTGDNGRFKEIWYKNNAFHRENGPAFIERDANGNITEEQWCYNGAYHREDGPATFFRWDDGKVTEICYKRGIYHFTGAPAYTVRSKDGVVLKEEWYDNGYMSNMNGPAIIRRDEKGNIIQRSFCIYSRYITETKFIRLNYLMKKFIRKLKNKYRKTLTLMLKDLDLFDESNLCSEVTKYMI